MDFLRLLNEAFKAADAKTFEAVKRIRNETRTHDRYTGEINYNGLRDQEDEVIFWRLLCHLLSKDEESIATTVEEITSELVKSGEIRMDLAYRVNKYLVFCRDREILNIKFGPSPHPLRPHEAPVSIDTGLLFFKWGFKRKEAT